MDLPVNPTHVWVNRQFGGFPLKNGQNARKPFARRVKLRFSGGVFFYVTNASDFTRPEILQNPGKCCSQDKFRAFSRIFGDFSDLANFGWPWLVRAARGFGVTSDVLRAHRSGLLDDWLRRERFVYVGGPAFYSYQRPIYLNRWLVHRYHLRHIPVHSRIGLFVLRGL